MSIETYEQIVENVGIDEAIMEAEAECKREGKLIDAKEALSSLKRKYFE
jgi:hypothetical protein